ncbi:nitronate monooxygenase [Paraburkholderia phymatum]|uniref:2-nitropropane dioxygenase NPD n=3 Tax=Paraburkholderia TaxID=1822464 RepID=B2JSC3_PARP8|nr:nitronate monooxygenase [Paraburkholderia phymatum]ACC73943.1 2-nitropropane dioxygenase NPD [Paraburkholderia phymatum STM815]PTB28711.1 nitronate monooxygenase [Paraburkholderia caribensis]QLB66531.1 monooxygenase [Paraburkholderia caribensis]
MKTELGAQFGIDLPIYAFSHCRDVVAAVTKAGGLGVLGAAWLTPEELEMSIEWIEKEVGGKPFGVDLVFPGTGGDEKSPEEYLKQIPQSHLSFVKNLLDEAGIPDFPSADRDEFMSEWAQKMSMTNKKSQEQLEVTLGKKSVSCVVGALGVTPDWVVKEAHSRGVKVGALVGSARHASKQKAAGVDFLVAQGTEAGGSVGSIASMVLWPQVVEAAAGVPVLAAGGVTRGSHILAALALGCQGVWVGSLWLGTAESDLNMEMREKLFQSESEDARLSFAMTGKQCRVLNTKYMDAWSQPDAPKPLKWPMQSILGGYPFKRAERSHNMDYWSYSVGQAIGDMKGHTTVKGEFERLLNEYLEALDRLNATTAIE